MYAYGPAGTGGEQHGVLIARGVVESLSSCARVWHKIRLHWHATKASLDRKRKQ